MWHGLHLFQWLQQQSRRESVRLWFGQMHQKAFEAVQILIKINRDTPHSPQKKKSKISRHLKIPEAYQHLHGYKQQGCKTKNSADMQTFLQQISSLQSGQD